MLHRIRHQILELELPREVGAVAMQRRASRVFQEQVLPRLDEAFSRIAPADRVLRIERLELDLGEIAEANWERDFVEKCVAQITEQVAETAFAVGSEHPVENLSIEENALAVFRYFLETGMLPWYAKHLNLTVLEEMVEEALAGGSGFWGQELRRVLKQNEGALQRMLWQFSVAFSEKILEAALGLTSGWVQQTIQIRQSQTGHKMTDRELVVLAKHLLSMEDSVLENTLPEPALLAQIFLEEKPAVATPPAAKPQAEPGGIPVENAGLVLLAPYLPPFFKQLGLELLGQNQLPESFKLSGTSKQSTILSTADQRAETKEDTTHDSSLLPAEAEAKEGITHHYKAVHLLHYLATGQERPEEPLLVLPKILCGLPLETPIPQDLDLSEEEKLEANRLLEAIVRNWPVLKKTSPDGLRSGFLQRAGLLSWSESRVSWVLQVERLGQDLLLEKVPWSYSVVKLPWMGAMVGVEW